MLNEIYDAVNRNDVHIYKHFYTEDACYVPPVTSKGNCFVITFFNQTRLIRYWWTSNFVTNKDMNVKPKKLSDISNDKSSMILCLCNTCLILSMFLTRLYNLYCKCNTLCVSDQKYAHSIQLPSI